MCDPKRSRTKLPTGGCHHVGKSWSRRVGYNLTANVKWKNGLASQESVCFWRSQIRSNITSCYYTWLNQFKPYVFVIFACLVLVVLLSNPKVSRCWHFQGDQWENPPCCCCRLSRGKDKGDFRELSHNHLIYSLV